MFNINTLDRLTRLCCSVFCYVSIFALGAMICVVMIDVIGDKIFNMPLIGSVDIVGLLGLVVVAFALGESKIRGYHISVEFVTSMLSLKHQHRLRVISASVSLILVSLLIWGSLKYAAVLQQVKEGTFTLGILMFPFIYMIVIGCLPLWLLFVLDLIDELKQRSDKEDGK